MDPQTVSALCDLLLAVIEIIGLLPVIGIIGLLPVIEIIGLLPVRRE